MAPKAKPKAKSKAKAKEEESVKKTNPESSRKLYFAVEREAPTKTLDLLVNFRFADPNVVMFGTRWTPLQRAVMGRSVRIVSDLLRLKANVNHKDIPVFPGTEDDGKKDKKKAAPSNDKNAPPPKKDKLALVPPDPALEGMTALHLSVAHGKVNILQRLLMEDKIDVNALDFRLRTPLWLACAEGKARSAKILLSANAEMSKDPAGRSCFTIATIRGHVRVMKVLIDHYPNCSDGTDNSANVTYKTAEHMPNICGLNSKTNRSVCDYLPDLDLKVVEFLQTLRHSFTPAELAHFSATRAGESKIAGQAPLPPGGRLGIPEVVELRETPVMRAISRHFTAPIDAAEKLVNNIIKALSGPPVDVKKELEQLNSSEQNVLHICGGALAVVKEPDSRPSSQGGARRTHMVGTDRGGLEELQRMLVKTADEEPAKEKMIVPICLSRETVWNQAGLKFFNHANMMARRRLHEYLTTALIDAARLCCPLALEAKDGRGLTPPEYLKQFRGETIVEMKGDNSDKSCRPFSASSMTCAATSLPSATSARSVTTSYSMKT
eukprot:GEMP01040886.1.p1 GENE.GEMP01040886.1~~GEMP01040886.1.p1  ORF type:complete len:550 (+),score=88.23 GEMP01040886.1:174-1823(+)